jgi:glycosyltransferase involved in cell wall biosynthesis
MSETRVPALIPAFEEQDYIGATLAAIDTRSVEPIVIVNGQNQGKTIDIVRNFADAGVTLLESAVQGQLPALQYGMSWLGERALDPVLLLDADSRPLRPKHWARAMTKDMPRDKPSVVAGPFAFEGGKSSDMVLRNIREYLLALKAQATHQPRVYGRNMALHLYDDDTLAAFMDLPHVWLHNDQMMANNVVSHDGDAIQAFGLNSTVITSARYKRTLLQILVRGKEWSNAQIIQSYRDRKAPSAIFSLTELQPDNVETAA